MKKTSIFYAATITHYSDINGYGEYDEIITRTSLKALEKFLGNLPIDDDFGGIVRTKIHERTYTQEEAKQQADILQVQPYFRMLRDGLENEDFNTVDFIFAQVSQYQYTENVQELVDILAEQVLNLEAEEAVRTIEKIEAVMGGEQA